MNFEDAMKVDIGDVLELGRGMDRAVRGNNPYRTVTIIVAGEGDQLFFKVEDIAQPISYERFEGMANCSREKHIGIDAGWTPVPRRDDGSWHNFEKGNTHVWPMQHGWQNAQLIDGRFCNHQPSSTLEEALAITRENES